MHEVDIMPCTNLQYVLPIPPFVCYIYDYVHNLLPINYLNYLIDIKSYSVIEYLYFVVFVRRRLLFLFKLGIGQFVHCNTR